MALMEWDKPPQNLLSACGAMLLALRFLHQHPTLLQSQAAPRGAQPLFPKLLAPSGTGHTMAQFPARWVPRTGGALAVELVDLIQAVAVVQAGAAGALVRVDLAVDALVPCGQTHQPHQLGGTGHSRTGAPSTCRFHQEALGFYTDSPGAVLQLVGARPALRTSFWVAIHQGSPYLSPKGWQEDGCGGLVVPSSPFPCPHCYGMLRRAQHVSFQCSHPRL